MMIPVGYKTQSPDTTIEAELIQFRLWRMMSKEQKLKLVKRMIRKGYQFALMGIYHQFPEATPLDLKQLFLEKRWGKKVKINLQGDLMLEDPLWLAHQLGSIFDTLQIPYYVSGSVASSLQGEVRFTEDLDLAIAITFNKIKPLIKALQGDFYISDIAVLEAIEGATSSFNVIHFETTEKADIFISRSDLFSESKMSRRQFYSAENEPEKGFYVCTPEDTILQKLVWYKLIDNQSQKQWRDILGVLKLQKETLDFNYLYQWGFFLEVSENLHQAFREAGIQENEL